MSFTPNANNAAHHNVGSSTTASVTIAAVNANDLVVVWAGCERDLTDITVSDGTATLHPCSDSTDINNGGVGGEYSTKFFYLLPAEAKASGSVTYVATFSSSTAHGMIVATTWACVGTPVLDTERNDRYIVSQSTGQTGKITTTGTDELVLVGQSHPGGTLSSRTINGVSPDATIDAINGEVYYKTFAATFTGQGSCNISPASNPRSSIVAFKIGTVGFSVQSTHQYLYGDTSGTNPTTGHQLTVVNSDVNKAVVVIGCGDNTLRAPTSLTRDGQSFTKIITKTDTNNFESVSIWYLDNPHVGNFALVPTWNSGVGSAASQIGIAGLCLTNAASGVPTITGNNGGTSANPTVTVAASVSGDIVVAGIASDLGGDGTTTGDQTEFGDIEDLAADSDVNMVYQYATGSNTVSSWTAVAPSGGAWAAAAVAFNTGVVAASPYFTSVMDPMIFAGGL